LGVVWALAQVVNPVSNIIMAMSVFI
jgi:hypothetical protein